MARIDCETCQEKMVDAYGGELSPSDRREFESHLESCTECAELWQDYQQLHASMTAWAGPQQAKPDTVAHILAAADRRVKKGPKITLHPWWKLLLSPPALAAAMLLLVAGVGLYSQRWLGEPSLKTLSAPVSVPASKPMAVPAGPQAEKRRTQDFEAKGDRVKKEAPRQPTAASFKTPEAPTPPKNEAVLPEGSMMMRQAPGRAEDLDSVSAPASAPAPAPVITEAEPATGGMGLGGTAPAKAKAPNARAPEESQRDAAQEEAKVEREKELTADKKSAQAESPKDESGAAALLSSAKKKIGAKDYAGALKDLEKAQKIHDSEEIKKLIRECKKRLAEITPQ